MLGFRVLGFRVEGLYGGLLVAHSKRSRNSRLAGVRSELSPFAIAELDLREFSFGTIGLNLDQTIGLNLDQTRIQVRSLPVKPLYAPTHLSMTRNIKVPANSPFALLCEIRLELCRSKKRSDPQRRQKPPLVILGHVAAFRQAGLGSRV